MIYASVLLCDILESSNNGVYSCCFHSIVDFPPAPSQLNFGSGVPVFGDDCSCWLYVAAASRGTRLRWTLGWFAAGLGRSTWMGPGSRHAYSHRVGFQGPSHTKFGIWRRLCLCSLCPCVACISISRRRRCEGGVMCWTMALGVVRCWLGLGEFGFLGGWVLDHLARPNHRVGCQVPSHSDTVAGWRSVIHTTPLESLLNREI
ncbi:hypothetical protein BS47DRAFT_2283 [Hydnum rufescens UP504]|uniref:Uncharacterized protein n=1 Tax=Hydnum rufescens UP504 TaxID=1448309 RepID=A0A9P6DZX2_9AGAM|nr:hypothetical protein BS47DRAFT_2283 [Hydnum rufescens UP504]